MIRDTEFFKHRYVVLDWCAKDGKADGILEYGAAVDLLTGTKFVSIHAPAHTLLDRIRYAYREFKECQYQRYRIEW